MSTRFWGSTPPPDVAPGRLHLRALTEAEYRDKLAASGFSDVGLTVLKNYELEDVPESLRSLAPSNLAESDTQIVSAFVEATKAGGQ